MTLTLPYTFQTGDTALAAEVNSNFSAVKTEVDLKIGNTLLTAKGDIIAATAASTPARLGVGTNAYALVADSTATNGIAWGQITATGLASDSVTQAKIADRAVGSAELTNLTLNAQTGTTYTLVLTDAQKLVTLSNASAITATIPPNSSVAFTIGDQVNLMQLGAGQVTVAAGSGVTVSSQGAKLKLNGQYAAATAVKVATDSWVLIGNLAA